MITIGGEYSIEKVVVSGEGLTLSQLVWKRFHTRREGLVEMIMEVNPGIASLGIYLPVGTEVLLPVKKEPADEKNLDLVTLWD